MKSEIKCFVSPNQNKKIQLIYYSFWKGSCSSLTSEQVKNQKTRILNVKYIPNSIIHLTMQIWQPLEFVHTLA